MNKLWVRLTLAIGIITTIGIVLAVLLINRQVSAQFRYFVARNQTLSTELAMPLVAYYAENGSWEGVETIVDTLHTPGGKGRGQGQGMQYGTPNLILADTDGKIVYDQSNRRLKQSLSKQEKIAALPLTCQTQTIGYLLVSEANNVQLSGRDQAFLEQVNLALVQAGMVAIVLGLLMGVILARNLSAPLSRLADVARRITRGQTSRRVPLTGVDELRDLAASFNEMADHLEEAEMLRRNMISDIAHELRTPLSVIQGNLQAIIDDVYPLEKTEIEDIYEESVMLHRLINDLHELAQAEAGQLSLNLEATDLVALAKNTASLFEGLAQERGIRFTFNAPADLPLVQADADRARQVLHNLLGNALRHTPEGGQIFLSIARAQSQGRSFLRISISDTGPGIPPDALPHVFDRFWRADKSRSREGGGTGLGLAIARQLVQAHGGQIGVESTVEQGSRFYFTLPAV
ncbi:MAG TPA: HAMP domain-containing protein [Chloroflexi bacterium]|nr:HAMP domain-containing protein [Chloroflexota bacterium]